MFGLIFGLGAQQSVCITVKFKLPSLCSHKPSQSLLSLVHHEWEFSSHIFLHSGEEAQILDYQTQQYRLFPLLATSYAMYFAGRFMYDFYLKATAQIEGGNLNSMPQVRPSCVFHILLFCNSLTIIFKNMYIYCISCSLL